MYKNLFYFFRVFTTDKEKWQIGRKTECDLVVNDQRFSREQTTFIYDKINGTWFIKDGGSEALSRTGTWLFVDKPYYIKQDIQFKLGPSLMKIESKQY